MNTLPTISNSEWTVASVVWNQPGLTATEIAIRLPDAGWKLKTLNTFLARLVSKKILAVERDGRAFRYRSLVPRESCVRAESDSFLQRVFGGAAAPMLAHFCERVNLTEAEIAELRGILNQRSTSAAARKSPSKIPKK